MCFPLPYNMFRCSTWISQSIWEMHLWVYKGSKEMWVGGFFACEYFGLQDPILLQKYILQYGQIYSIIWIDIFCNLDIYIYRGSREFWVGGFLHVNTLAGEIPFRCANTFCNLDKYILQFGQIHLQGFKRVVGGWVFTCEYFGWGDPIPLHSECSSYCTVPGISSCTCPKLMWTPKKGKAIAFKPALYFSQCKPAFIKLTRTTQAGCVTCRSKSIIVFPLIQACKPQSYASLKLRPTDRVT